jgi:hypothetical protein
MQPFLLLSGSWAFISNAIFEGERSLKQTSTASRLMFVPPLSTTTLVALATAFRLQPHANIRLRAPPLYWGMWAQKATPRLPHKRGWSHSRPSPFQRDVGLLCSLDKGIREGETRGGTQEVRNPSGMSTKTNYDQSRSSSSSFPPFHPTWPFPCPART